MARDWKLTAKRAGVMAIATGGFVGFFPVAPGTMGSLVSALFLWGIESIPLWVHLVIVVALSVLGAWACERAGKILNKPDASPLVIDEIVGVLIAMLGIPLTSYWLIWGFLWFRFFDIVKIPPANYADTHLKNGWGVMLDDIVAGIYSNIILHLMMRAQF